MGLFSWAALACWALSALLVPAHGEFLLGTGKGDVTGPAADVNLMGYANPAQTAQGIHIRLYARSFIFADKENPARRFVYVNADACMASQLVSITVMSRLKAMYGDLYTADNVAISGTHTHASAAGFLQYVLYTITSLGFVQQSFDALVDGIVESINQAHRSLRPGSVWWAEGELVDGNINRSPTAYLANPPQERAQYQHNVDKSFRLLKLLDGQGRGIGALSWYAVHCTSMNNTNRLLSGDNKGAAEQLLEAWAAPAGSAPRRAASGAAGQLPPAAQEPMAEGFVGAFAQSNVGDTSPNTQGAFCLDTGLPCEPLSSTCNGRTELCHGRGPAWPNDRASTAIIGRLQFEKAVELWGSATEQVSGPIDFRHRFIDMSSITVQASAWTRAGRTCPPAMGYSFAAGTTDGPGAFDFKQGSTNGTIFWNLVRNFLKAPSQEQQARHAPKPILLDTSLDVPYPWQPRVVEVGLLRLGQVAVVCVPGEFTSMAGRRMRAAVADVLRPAWGADVRVVLSGLTGTYSSYVTTWEEYQVQRYEGASTIFGPHTLDAYIQEVRALATAMVAGQATPSSVQPPNLSTRQISLLSPVVVDTVPLGAQFGQVYKDVVQRVYLAGDTASATFRSGCPRNNLRRNGTFLAVERQVATGWQTVHTDADWCTTFHWTRPFQLSPESFAEVSWQIPAETPAGRYRLVHFGDYRTLFQAVVPFRGVSAEFEVGSGGWSRAWSLTAGWLQAWG